MEKKINYPGITIFLLAISILAMSIGFAVRSEKLRINGSTTIGESPKWNVHFENIEVSQNSVFGESVRKPATIINNESTFINYDVVLTSYNDSYEFTVDLVNEGNINARISSVMYTLSDEAKKYLDYSIEYEDGTKVLEGDELPKRSKKKIKVKLQNIFKEDVVGEKQFDISFALEVVQK